MKPMFNLYKHALPKAAKLFAGSLAAACAFTSNTFAQTNSDAPWYQIEVIIVERLTSAAQTEVWPKDIVLAYPAKSRYLEFIAQEETTDEQMQNQLTAQEGAIAPSAVEADLTEQPFIPLATADQQLNSIAKRIARTNHLHLLFHQAWRQPLTGADQAPAIVVQAGKQFDDHYELEGSLKVSVSRYLHIDANLWLTAFEANYGQPQGQWPELPEAPINVANIVIEQSIGNELGDDNENLLDEDVNQPAEPAPSEISSQQLDSLLFAEPTTDNLGGFNFNTGMKPVNEAPEPEKIKNFVVTQIVTLQQQRRMRSGELHYIDHPKLGLLVKVTPYDPNAPSGAEKTQ